MLFRCRYVSRKLEVQGRGIFKTTFTTNNWGGGGSGEKDVRIVSETAAFKNVYL